MTKKYYEFVENNDHEGESWSFYVPLTEEEYLHLQNVLSNFTQEQPYVLEEDEISEKDVDKLVKKSKSGYMPFHNKCSGSKVALLAVTFEDIEDDDPFYKGNIWIREK